MEETITSTPLIDALAASHAKFMRAVDSSTSTEPSHKEDQRAYLLGLATVLKEGSIQEVAQGLEMFLDAISAVTHKQIGGRIHNFL